VGGSGGGWGEVSGVQNGGAGVGQVCNSGAQGAPIGSLVYVAQLLPP